jgi:hypothetical protein
LWMELVWYLSFLELGRYLRNDQSSWWIIALEQHPEPPQARQAHREASTHQPSLRSFQVYMSS